MKDLFTGIYSKFAELTGTPPANNALFTALSGRLYNTFAPEPATYPYGVFLLVSGVPDWTFTDDMENVLIQVSLFDNLQSSANICAAYDALDALYHTCTLSMSNYTSIYMWREMQHLLREFEADIGGPGIWQYVVQFRILLQKDTAYGG